MNNNGYFSTLEICTSSYKRKQKVVQWQKAGTGLCPCHRSRVADSPEGGSCRLKAQHTQLTLFFYFLTLALQRAHWTEHVAASLLLTECVSDVLPPTTAQKIQCLRQFRWMASRKRQDSVFQHKLRCEDKQRPGALRPSVAPVSTDGSLPTAGTLRFPSHLSPLLCVFHSLHPLYFPPIAG